MTSHRSFQHTDDLREQRGFALYVGMSESKARENGVELSEVVDALRRELTRRIPFAECQALAVVGPIGASSRDLDVVMRAAIERAPEPNQRTLSPESKVDIGVVIDLARHRVLSDDHDARLTFKEFTILGVLVRNAGKTLTREQLRKVIATDEEAEVNDRTIDVHIRRMRIKLGAYRDLVRTVHGKGYRFDPRRDVEVLRH